MSKNEEMKNENEQRSRRDQRECRRLEGLAAWLVFNIFHFPFFITSSASLFT
jgi:hypothetical protein